MITEENQLLPHESLSVIAEVISKTKDNFKANSFYFLLWGWLIAIASFSFFLLHQYTSFRYYFLPFPVLVITGILVTLSRYVKSRAVSRTETYFGYFFSRLWLVLGISFIIVVFVTVSQKSVPFSYSLIIAAIGTLVSGLTMNFKPLIAGGILFFVCAIASVYLPDNDKPLLTGVAIIAGYLIPGYLLRSSKSIIANNV
ncbi:MAG TPA: hypothetical protein VL832_03980 [Puia sp.]|nr:hypothetical protein [Puia sp.]